MDEGNSAKIAQKSVFEKALKNLYKIRKQFE